MAIGGMNPNGTNAGGRWGIGHVYNFDSGKGMPAPLGGIDGPNFGPIYANTAYSLSHSWDALFLSTDDRSSEAKGADDEENDIVEDYAKKATDDNPYVDFDNPVDDGTDGQGPVNTAQGPTEDPEETNNSANPPSKQIIYYRTTQTDQSTTGVWYIPGTDISGYMLEPPGQSSEEEGSDQRIDAGTYNLELNTGKKYGLRLDDVPGRSDIIIHTGNYPGDTEGCLLPGVTVGSNSVGTNPANSYNTVKQLVNYFNNVGWNGATITIIDQFP